MSRPREIFETLEPSNAVYPQTQSYDRGNHRAQQSLPLERLPDIFPGYESPYKRTPDQFDRSSLMLSRSGDLDLGGGFEHEHPSLIDGHNASQTSYSPQISPKLAPHKTELPGLTTNDKFDMEPAMSRRFEQSDEGPGMLLDYGHDLFPTYGHNQPSSPNDLDITGQMSPPKISINYAPPTKDNHINRSSRSIADGETSSPPTKRELNLVLVIIVSHLLIVVSSKSQ